jgi:hypothetical protein
LKVVEKKLVNMKYWLSRKMVFDFVGFFVFKRRVDG